MIIIVELLSLKEQILVIHLKFGIVLPQQLVSVHRMITIYLQLRTGMMTVDGQHIQAVHRAVHRAVLLINTQSTLRILWVGVQFLPISMIMDILLTVMVVQVTKQKNMFL